MIGRNSKSLQAMGTTGRIAFDDGSKIIQTKCENASHYELRNESICLEEYYEIDWTARIIKEYGFRQVSLQFPDVLLRDSYVVSHLLQDAVMDKDVHFFVLGDTSYGSCCVDEVAAQHLSADCVVHYGRGCLSPTSRLPVIYVFGRQPLNVIHCADTVKKHLEVMEPRTPIILLYEPCYSYIIKDVVDLLPVQENNIFLAKMKLFCDPRSNDVKDLCADPTQLTESSFNTSNPSNPSNLLIGGQQVELSTDVELKDCTLLYIGRETPHLTNIMMQCNSNPCFTYSPPDQIFRKETIGVNKKLMRRFYLVQRAKEAGIIGILVGTLGVAKYLQVVRRLQDLIKGAGRKSYVFVVGKINVPKLANYAEIDLFVIVACPENSMIDSKEFYKPIVTPFELEIALDPRKEWSGEYHNDFQSLLDSTNMNVIDQEKEDEDKPFYSLLSGTFRSMEIGTSVEGGTEEKGELVCCNSNTELSTYTSPAALFLKNREYQGLEPRTGENEIHAAKEGRKGIAKGYQDEI